LISIAASVGVAFVGLAALGSLGSLAALGSLATLFYFISVYMGSNR
jgi:hypothetical protein